MTVGLYAKADGKKLAACAVLVNVNERQAASCPGGEACPSASFLDTPEADHWAHGGIDFALQAGLFNGTDARHFEPDGSMTRGMLVTVLWRLAGKPEAEGALPFADVDANAYYAEPIRWAAQNADILIAPIALVLKDSMMGEITGNMAAAVGSSRATRILVPTERCGTHVAGAHGVSMQSLVEDAARQAAALAAQA